jgi:hypothetical protein
MSKDQLLGSKVINTGIEYQGSLRNFLPTAVYTNVTTQQSKENLGKTLPKNRGIN